MKGLVQPWQTALAICGAWIALLMLALLSRHLLAVDETRYVSVAWEMWLRGDLLVPHLNGEPYEHKPPLLFWLIHLVWQLFGVSEAAARLVPAFAGLVGALLVMPMAALLWPRQRACGPVGAWIVFTLTFWAVWTTAMMFDLLVAVCAEIALFGVLMAWRGRAAAGWLVAGVGIGLGILAKGPVILIYVLPAALLAPWWMTEQRPASWLAWYGGTLAAILLGTAIGLSWALPAAVAGGEAYANGILWGQTTGRVVESFAHQRPFWWYLPLLPLLLFPWSLWFPLWRGLRERWLQGWDSGERLTLVVAATGLLIFSSISGKQAHYLLPLFPALALFAARGLSNEGPRQPPTWAPWLPAAPLLVLGVAVTLLPAVGVFDSRAAWVEQLPPWVGAPVLAALILAIVVARSVSVLAWPGVLSLLFLGAAYPGIVREVAKHYDVHTMASAVAAQQDLGRPVAFAGKYRGEFNFAGRLRIPLTPLRHGSIASWAAVHPDGLLVHRTDERPGPDARGIHFWRTYRSDYLVLRDVSSWRPVPDDARD
ncbi:MAG: glycosyltransferase family 39 protein [Chromatiaceae bacterium]|jgi:4-amino-4-deoxy-L-arabinose transferase-like glycosyltransferase